MPLMHAHTVMGQSYQLWMVICLG